VARAIPARLAAFDPDMQLSEVRTMKHWLGEKLVRPRFAAALQATFGALALVLAAVGTYGLLAYSVAQRTKEIGIRMALGANPRAIVSGVIGRGLRLTSVAIVLGLAGSLALTRLLACSWPESRPPIRSPSAPASRCCWARRWRRVSSRLGARVASIRWWRSARSSSGGVSPRRPSP
jgi:hypothetical protein